jgi:predicted transcriptional regulator
MSNSLVESFGLPGEQAGRVRRSPLEMVCDILGVMSQGPMKPTHILYKANMSWKVLSSYLEFLTVKGLIQRKEEEGGERSLYSLTLKGESILRLYVGLLQSLSGTLSQESSEELGRLAATVLIGTRAPTSEW